MNQDAPPLISQIGPAPEPLILHPGFGRGFRAIWLLTWQTRLAWRRIPALVFTVAFIPVMAWVTVDPEQSEAYFRWLLDIHFFLLVPLFCLGVFGGMIRDEIQGDTLGFLITRPVSRARLFLLKYFCHLIWVQLLMFLSAALLFLAGALRQIPGLGSLIFFFFIAQFLAICAYGALSAFFGLFSQRYVILGILYGFIVEMGIGRIPTNINAFSMSHHIRTILGNVSLVNDLYGWSPDRTGFSIFIMLAATLLLLGLCMAIFTWNEYHQTEEMQK